MKIIKRTDLKKEREEKAKKEEEYNNLIKENKRLNQQSIDQMNALTEVYEQLLDIQSKVGGE